MSSRGIEPQTLLGLVENTVPFLFQNGQPLTPFTKIVLEIPQDRPLSHLEYFSLCLGSHYTTVASFVPTDVDNQIRKHLWNPSVDSKTLEAMASLTLESLNWDFCPLTARFQFGEDEVVSGHHGEWFSVAVGAYAAHRESNPALAKAIGEQILLEAKREAKIFQHLKKIKDGIGLLKACTLISHNLGDLDRVIDQWELPPSDFLRISVYKLAHHKLDSFGPLQTELLEAGSLNKFMMASENHRHYPLRKPKCLRRSLDFFLPTGPFFDTWGETIGKHPLLQEREIIEVAEALLEGFARLSSEKIPLYGYARALGGIQRGFGANRLVAALPSKAAKNLERGNIASINREDQGRFEGQWAKKALFHLKLL